MMDHCKFSCVPSPARQENCRKTSSCYKEKNCALVWFWGIFEANVASTRRRTEVFLVLLESKRLMLELRIKGMEKES